MTKRGKIITGIIIGLVVLVGGTLYWLYFQGGLQLLADYTAPASYWDLTDGDAMTGPEIGEFLHSYNPNIPVEAGNTMATHCQTLNVNPAFAIAIAKADSNIGLSGVGMRNKNPGNTKISYRRLDELGIGHADYRAGQNFAAFDDWGDGFAAICVTLANYRYYNLSGSLNLILRRYAGDPSPNYYYGVSSTMNQLLSTIDISGTVYEDGTAKELKIPGASVALKQEDGSIISIVKSDVEGNFFFGPLPRRIYTLEAYKENYIPLVYTISSPHVHNQVEMTLVLKDELRNYTVYPLLAGHGIIKGQVKRLIIDPLETERITLKATNLVSGQVYSTTTDADGNYIFYNIPKGKYNIEILQEADVLSGFYYARELDLTTQTTAEVDFYL